MWKLISAIVLAALGIVTAKKCFSSSKRGIHIPSPNEEKFSNSSEPHNSRPNQIHSKKDEFDLSKLQPLFDAFSIEVTAYDALYHLLNAIEKKSYNETLKAIVEKAKTPSDLVELANSPLPDDAFNEITFIQGQGSPCINKDYIIKLCIDKGISEVGSLDDLVKRLIAANTKSGMQHFNIVYGYRIQSMKEGMDRGEDVSVKFKEIMNKIAEKI